MASRKTKQRKIVRVLRKASDDPAPVATHPERSYRFRGAGVAFQIVIFLTAFAILFSRRPDAVLNAQFYAEDGMVWYPDAYQFGLHSYLMPVAGYLHALIRTVALLSLLVPFSTAPLVMNLWALVVEILPVNVFLSSRFSNINLTTRLLGSALYLALPNTFEVHANITNVQWHLVLIACMLLLARPASSRVWQIFDAVVLVLASLSSPISVLLVCVAAAMWWKRRERQSLWGLALLVPGALVEVLVALLSHTREPVPNGATIGRLISILGQQLFLSALLGMNTQLWLAPTGMFLVAVVAATVGLGIVLYALLYAPAELRVFILFSFSVLALGLARPLAGSPGRPQWEWLCVPGCGNRYYFLAMIASFAALFWIVGNTTAPNKLRYFAVGLLLLLPIGIYQDWRYPQFADLDFPKHAVEFEQAPPGTQVTIPINPSMLMKLTKR